MQIGSGFDQEEKYAKKMNNQTKKFSTAELQSFSGVNESTKTFF